LPGFYLQNQKLLTAKYAKNCRKEREEKQNLPQAFCRISSQAISRIMVDLGLGAASGFLSDLCEILCDLCG